MGVLYSLVARPVGGVSMFAFNAETGDYLGSILYRQYNKSVNGGCHQKGDCNTASGNGAAAKSFGGREA